MSVGLGWVYLGFLLSSGIQTSHAIRVDKRIARKDRLGEPSVVNHFVHLAPKRHVLGATTENGDTRIMDSAIEGPGGPLLQLQEQLLDQLKGVLVGVVPHLSDLVLGERAPDGLSAFD